MTIETYSGLHCHSMYSLDGVGNVSQWVKGAKEKGLYGVSLTDHGGCESLLELYYTGKKENYPVLMGCEFYLIKQLGDKDYYHLTVLAKNFDGYKNLCKLATIATHKNDTGPENHFYKRPRITMDELFNNKAGLMIMSGCLAGPLCKEILNNNPGIVEDYIREFHKKFGDDYYLELQPSIVIDDKGDYANICKQTIVNQKLLSYAKQFDLPVVLTPDAHIVHKQQKILQDIKLHARSGKNWDFDQSHHLFTPSEFREKIKLHHSYMSDIVDEGFKNSNIVMDRGQFEITEFKPLLPTIDLQSHPLYSDGDTQNNLMVKIICDNKRVDFNNPVYTERLKYEIDTLVNNGTINLLPYFLLLEDVIRWSKKNGIVSGPGRGSAAGSLLAYSFGLTHLDPIKFGLSFDRFINKARVLKGTLPDIDIDFSSHDAIKKYVVSKYGEDKVASIGVFQTLKTKGAIKDVLSALRPEMTFVEKNNLTAPLASSQQGDNELDFFHESLEKHPILANFMKANADVYESIVQLLGQSRQRGSHPCAVVISPIPLIEIMPLWYDNGNWVSQYSAEWCNKAGVIKYDFLSLNTLKDISECIRLVKSRTGIEIDPYNLNWNDQKTLAAFSRGDTDTIFQFHTPIAKALLKNMGADSLNDLAATTSLGRPGPMDVGMDKAYSNRKQGLEAVDHLHDSLKDIVGDTYGIMVYQEQVMAAVQILGGFSLEEADDVRRAMGKKDKKILDNYKEAFKAFAIKTYSDIDDNRAESLWSKIESFARYGFNKSHAACYAMIGFICQYLKQNYPTEWYCAVFSNGTKEDRKKMFYLLENLIVLPNINQSKKDFYIDNDKIISSLDFIECLGERSVDEICSKQPFYSFQDFFTRINKRIIKKDVFVALIFSGCLDSLEPEWSRNDFLEKYFTGMKSKTGVPVQFRNLTELDLKRKKLEYLPMGAINYNDMFSDKIMGEVNEFYYILNEAANEKDVSIIGSIEKIIKKTTKKGDEMAFLELSNSGLKLRVTVWPREFAHLESILKKGQIVQIWGSVNMWNTLISVVLNKITVINE